MERNANYALVGIASILLFLGMVVFAFWLARFQFTKEYDLYDINFVGPVRGISEGGEVHFNGIKVGEVSKIALDKVNPANVVATVRVTSDVPIRTDSYATLEPQGITGVNYIQITAGTASKPLLKTTVPKGTKPVIASKSSALSDLLQGSGTVLAATVDALNRINRILSDDNIKSLTASMHNVQAVTDELRQRKAVIEDADNAVKSIDQAAQSLKQVADSGQQMLGGDGKRALHDVADAADEIKATSIQAHQMITKLQGPTGDFATTGLPQLTQAAASLQQTAESLNRLVNEIEQNPQALVSKSPAKEVQVKP
ncbi:MAG TPA: MlaD family protein [Caulobacteraceae bacterium]|jgi:phospholipid/cholesterol/gamma-HCH transport system substrate-binding protein